MGRIDEREKKSKNKKKIILRTIKMSARLFATIVIEIETMLTTAYKLPKRK